MLENWKAYLWSYQTSMMELILKALTLNHFKQKGCIKDVCYSNQLVSKISYNVVTLYGQELIVTHNGLWISKSETL